MKKEYFQSGITNTFLQFRNLLKIAEKSFNNWTEFG